MAKAKQSGLSEPVKVEEKVSKMDAVRAALDADKSTAATGVPWIHEKYGIEIAANIFNSYKSNIANKDKGNGTAQTRTKAGADDSNSFPLETVKAVKEVMDAHSVEAIMASVDLVKKYGVGGVGSALQIVTLFSDR